MDKDKELVPFGIRTLYRLFGVDQLDVNVDDIKTQKQLSQILRQFGIQFMRDFSSEVQSNLGVIPYLPQTNQSGLIDDFQNLVCDLFSEFDSKKNANNEPTHLQHDQDVLDNLMQLTISMTSFKILKQMVHLPKIGNKTSLQVNEWSMLIEDIHRRCTLNQVMKNQFIVDKWEIGERVVSVYDRFDLFQLCKLDEPFASMPKVCYQKISPEKIGTPSIVPFDEFQRNFDAITGSQFTYMDWSNVVIAGGVVSACLTGVPEEYKSDIKSISDYFFEGDCKNSDIDIFIYGLSDSQAVEKVKEIAASVCKVHQQKIVAVRTVNALSLCTQFPFRNVQIILRLYNSREEVLSYFDLDSVCVGYDGKQVFALPRAVRSYNTRLNVIDVSVPRHKYEERLCKYTKRGFGIGLPYLDIESMSPLYRAIFNNMNSCSDSEFGFPNITGKKLQKWVRDFHEISRNLESPLRLEGFAKLLSFLHWRSYASYLHRQGSNTKPKKNQKKENSSQKDVNQVKLSREGEEEGPVTPPAGFYSMVFLPFGQEWTSPKFLNHLEHINQSYFQAQLKHMAIKGFKDYKPFFVFGEFEAVLELDTELSKNFDKNIKWKRGDAIYDFQNYRLGWSWYASSYDSSIKPFQNTAEDLYLQVKVFIKTVAGVDLSLEESAAVKEFMESVTFYKRTSAIFRTLVEALWNILGKYKKENSQLIPVIVKVLDKLEKTRENVNQQIHKKLENINVSQSNDSGPNLLSTLLQQYYLWAGTNSDDQIVDAPTRVVFCSTLVKNLMEFLNDFKNDNLDWIKLKEVLKIPSHHVLQQLQKEWENWNVEISLKTAASSANLEVIRQNKVSLEKSLDQKQTELAKMEFLLQEFPEIADTQDETLLQLKKDILSIQKSLQSLQNFSSSLPATQPESSKTKEQSSKTSGGMKKERIVSEDDLKVEVVPTKKSFKKPEKLHRKCYMCKTIFHVSQGYVTHPKLCQSCGTVNAHFRNLSCDLKGLIALVTGARIKIGYAIALKLLRAGATVIATTRFLGNALSRYQQESDFGVWKERLHLYGVDFKNLPAVELFLDHILSNYDHLDILINNAAQTIQRPPEFYAHLLQDEIKIRELISFPESSQQFVFVAAKDAPLSLSVHNQGNVQSENPEFPPGRLDEHGQQLDLRNQNSWTLTLEQLSTDEILQVFAINSIVPTLFVSKLKLLMMKNSENSNQLKKPQKFIINVSSPEGQFYTIKGVRHPHTNQAKAALNMLTRTCAEDYAKDNIFVNSVDTGWISKMFPTEEAKAHGQPPLDEVDGAARVLHPIFAALQGGRPMFGKFFQNFQESMW